MLGTIKYVVIFAFLSISASAQHYSFHYLNAGDQYSINNDGDQVYCLFRTKKSKTEAVYRKVFLREDLSPFDSVEYQIAGDPTLVASGESSYYTYHAFETKVEKVSMFQFLVTDKSGNIVYQYNKTSADFISFFGREIKIKNIQLNFIPDNDKNILLVEITEKDGRFNSRLAAWNISDGSVIWKSDITSLGFVRTTETQIIGLTKIGDGNRTAYVIHFIDKATGKRISGSIGRSLNPRSVDVVATNGSQVMIAGAESQSDNKHSKLYMSMLDMQGTLIFDKMDTTDRMAKYRHILMGSTFDRSGNLVLIGEGYKLDATRMVVTTALSVGLAVLGGGGYIATGGVDNRIDFVSAAVLSPENGEVISYKNFPVGPWYDFATFYSDGDHVLIGIHNKFLLYDITTPDVAPSQFASLKTREQLILTSFGPAVVYRDTGKHRIVVEMVGKDLGEKP